MTLRPIRDYKGIESLDHHLVIEASAGTGKTYTIENIVVRLLEENKELQLEEILLVTFTEKATSEMRERIRINLQKKLNELKTETIPGVEDENQKSFIVEKLQRCINHFDESAIHTIHGFCQGILQHYAFENSKVFELELIDDDRLYEKLLHEIQRKDWLKSYGDDLAKILALTEFPKVQLDESSWEKTVLSISKRWQPDAGDCLSPEQNPKFNETFIDTQVQEFLGSIRPLLVKTRVEAITESPVYLKFDALKMNSRTKESILNKVLVPLLKLLTSNKSGFELFGSCNDFLRTCTTYSKFRNEGFRVLIPELLPGQERFSSELENLIKAAQILLNLPNLLDRIRNQFLINTVCLLKEKVKNYKAEQGLISFSDMISQMANALDSDKNPKAELLLSTLRSRFRYAIVDEFQDTDRLQWKIFKRIFFDTHQKHRLFIVGDPKQSIYGFRGADVETYLAAKKEILSHPLGRGYTLNTNWRSIPELTSSLNSLFSSSSTSWFDASDSIHCIDLKSPTKPWLTDYQTLDNSDRGPVNLVNFSSSSEDRHPGHKIVRHRMAVFIANEIHWLLGTNDPGNDHPKMMVFDRISFRPLEAGDLCILIRGKADLVPLERILRKERIPYTHFKKPGLYSSEEAGHLVYLLSAIANPRDQQAFLKALLTCFFRISIEKIEHFRAIPDSHPILQLFEKWNLLAEKRRWPNLFQSILRDTGVLLSGKYTISDSEMPRSPRSSTNLRHILNNLENEAAENRWDIADLVDYLKQLRYRNLRTDHEADLHRLESEKPLVKIMTIHAAKGLQFPIVFLAGGFTKGQNSNFAKYHNQDGALVYDLTNDTTGKKLHEKEEDYEDRRQYYVALTRAVYKVYIPKVPALLDKKSARFAGPLSTFIFSGIDRAWFQEPSCKTVNILAFNEHQRSSQGHRPILNSKEESPQDRVSGRFFDGNGQIFYEPGTTVAFRKTEIYSFTQLSSQATIASHPIHIKSHGYSLKKNIDTSESLDVYFGDDFKKGDSEKEGPDLVHASEEVEEELLPRGKTMGLLLHEILEEIDYQEVYHANSPNELVGNTSLTGTVIRKKLNQFIFKKAFKVKDEGDTALSIAECIFRALRTPVCLNGKMKPLCHPKIKRRHEVEFYFPLFSSNFNDYKAELEKWENELVYKNGYLTGFIDLVFSFENKFFLLDWKSNFLDCYTLERLQESMDDENYHLQYQIYTIALKRWLASVFGDKEDFAEKFGGIFYIYLRGVNGMNTTSGVYFKDSNDVFRNDYEGNLLNLVGMGSK